MRHVIVLARTRGPGDPECRPADGYDFVAPLRSDGRLDVAATQDVGLAVRRLSPDHPARYGHLVRGPDGSGGTAWRPVYVGAAEPATARLRLDDRPLVEGETVFVRDAASHECGTYRVARVRESRPFDPVPRSSSLDEEIAR
jgi:hypothetical protein